MFIVSPSGSLPPTICVAYLCFRSVHVQIFSIYKLELGSLLSGDIKMTPDQPQTLVSQWHISCVWQLISIQVSKREQEE